MLSAFKMHIMFLTSLHAGWINFTVYELSNTKERGRITLFYRLFMGYIFQDYSKSLTVQIFVKVKVTDWGLILRQKGISLPPPLYMQT